jgi:hypothetical protein
MYFRFSALARAQQATCGQFVPFAYNSQVEALVAQWIRPWQAFRDNLSVLNDGDGITKVINRSGTPESGFQRAGLLGNS